MKTHLSVSSENIKSILLHSYVVCERVNTLDKFPVFWLKVKHQTASMIMSLMIVIVNL